MSDETWKVKTATRTVTERGQAYIGDGGALGFQKDIWTRPHKLYARHAWVEAELVPTPKETP